MEQVTKEYTGNSAIVCLALPEPEAVLLHGICQSLNPDITLEKPEDLHITLAYFEDVEEIGDKKAEIFQIVKDFAVGMQPVSGKINGGGIFNNQGDGKPVWAYYESNQLFYVRQALVNKLMGEAVRVERPYGFIPHITMSYLTGQDSFNLQFPTWPILFTNLSLWWAGERYDFPFNVSENEKEVSSMPVTAYAHGPGGLLSQPGLEDEDKMDDELLDEASKAADEALGPDSIYKGLWMQAYIQKATGKPMKTESDGKHPSSHYLVVEDRTKPTTWHMVVRNTRGDLDPGFMGAAWAALTSNHRGNPYMGPNKQQAISKLRKLYAQIGRKPPGERKQKDTYFAVFKDASGRYRWLAISSTSYQDKDGQIVSKAALEKAVARMGAANDYGPLLFWHEDDLVFGDCDYSNVLSKSLVETGYFKTETIAKAVARKAARYKMSIGFKYPKSALINNVFEDIYINERSIVPADLASNAFTGLYVSEVNMNDTQKAQAVLTELKSLLPEDEVNMLWARVGYNEKSADKMGVAHKDATNLAELSPPELLEYARQKQAAWQSEQDTKFKAINELVGGIVDQKMAGYVTKMDEFLVQFKEVMEKGAMPNKMDGKQEDDEEQPAAATKDAQPDPQLAAVQGQVVQLQTQLKAVNDTLALLANATPRRATQADDNVINRVQNANQVVQDAKKAANGNSQAPPNMAQTLKDNAEEFYAFLAGGVA